MRLLFFSTQVEGYDSEKDLIKIVEHSGFIEPSTGVPSKGFAIRKVAKLRLYILKNATPNKIIISIFKNGNEWRNSKIKAKINSSTEIVFKPFDTNISKFEIELKNYRIKNYINLEFRVHPMGINKLITHFLASIKSKRPIYLVRDALLISEISIDQNKILRYEDKNRFNFVKYESTNKINVRILGFFSQTFGLAEAGRRTFKSIQNSKLKVCATQVPFTGKHRGDEKNNSIEKSLPIEKNEIRIFHFNGDHLERLISDWGSYILNCKYKIGFWHWELPEFPDDNLQWFDKVDEIWVPSRFVFDAIAPKSSKPVQVIPLAVDDQILKPPPPNRKKFSIPLNKFVFLITFDFYSILERKNPIAGIKAFSFLLKDDEYKEEVHLVVKISNHHADSKGYKLFQEALSLIDAKKITLINKVVPRNDMLQLMNSCDSLVSLHRSEGFGLHIAEAMAMGKSVLTTNWSGNVDFANESNSYPVNFKIQQIQKNTGSYRKGNSWATADIGHAVSQMKKILKNKFLSDNDIQQNAKNQIRELHSIKRVSSIIEKRIQIIRSFLADDKV